MVTVLVSAIRVAVQVMFAPRALQRTRANPSLTAAPSWRTSAAFPKARRKAARMKTWRGRVSSRLSRLEWYLDPTVADPIVRLFPSVQKCDLPSVLVFSFRGLG